MREPGSQQGETLNAEPGEVMSTREHWDAIYRHKAPDSVSWYRPHLEQSLAWIDSCALDPRAHVVDVGGGASTLVDNLLDRGFERISVVDLSAQALAQAQARLGDSARAVRWVVGDATTQLFDKDSVDLWHDRAVFHFLTEPAQRDAYIAALRRSVRQGGYVIIATFGPQGPERCSGLPVVRYSPAGIAAALGSDFVLENEANVEHTTPAGASQAFAYALCRRSGG
jgi:ubiquinone/menaquinone biosynthesis C-methylase UbiE